MCQKGPLHYLLQIRDVRLRGGDVIVSFGGAAGQELAQVVTDENALVRQERKSAAAMVCVLRSTTRWAQAPR